MKVRTLGALRTECNYKTVGRGRRSRILWSRRGWTIALLILMSPMFVALIACSNEGVTSGSFKINIRSNPAGLNRVGPTTVKARCDPGEQLLGGGYELDRPNLESGGPVVDASYPSDTNEWTVVAGRGPQQAASAAPEVTVHAYCVASATHLPLRLRVFKSTPTTVPAATTVPPPVTRTTVGCPPGSVLTSGGYQTSHSRDDGLYNAWVLGSGPTLDPVGHATGWRVDQAVITGPAPTTVTYALCATENLSSVDPTAPSSILETEPPFYNYRGGLKKCDSTAFATGGGYDFLGDSLAPHPLYFSDAMNQNAGWQVEGIHGHQAGDTSTTMQAWAICNRIPDTGLTVDIDSPADGESFGPVIPTGRTHPIRFLATAYSNGSASDPATLVWTWKENGQPFGQAAHDFMADLPADSNSIALATVSVTVTDKSSKRMATDSVVIRLGVVG